MSEYPKQQIGGGVMSRIVKYYSLLRSGLKFLNWHEMKRLMREFFPPWKSPLWIATNWKQKALLVVSALLIAMPFDDMLMAFAGVFAFADEVILGILSLCAVAIVQRSQAYLGMQYTRAMAEYSMLTEVA